VVLSEELCILSSCFLSPMSKNSVLGELRVRRLAKTLETSTPSTSADVVTTQPTPHSQYPTSKITKCCSLDMETLSTVGTTTSETATTEQTGTSIFTAEMTTGRSLILFVYVFYA